MRVDIEPPAPAEPVYVLRCSLADVHLIMDVINTAARSMGNGPHRTALLTMARDLLAISQLETPAKGKR